jgi:hypothetical protein
VQEDESVYTVKAMAEHPERVIPFNILSILKSLSQRRSVLTEEEKPTNGSKGLKLNRKRGTKTKTAKT